MYSGGTGRPYLVEGVGEDFWPTAYDGTVVDEIIASSDAESFAMTLRLAREEGLLVGGSSGLAVASGLKAARDLPADAVMVILLPDSGRGYLGKVFNDKWMRSYGFSARATRRRSATSSGSRTASCPTSCTCIRADTVRDAIEIMTKYDVSQMPVLTAEPPVVMGEVVGAINERDLLEHVFGGGAKMTDVVRDSSASRSA